MSNTTDSTTTEHSQSAAMPEARPDNGGVVSFDPATDPAAVQLTPAAARHLSQSLRKQAARAVRLGVTESGCNGYMYELSYAAAIEPADHRYEFALDVGASATPDTDDNSDSLAAASLAAESADSASKDSTVTVVVAPQDLPLVQGTQIDYVTEGLNSALKFANPNADTHCGCGESFSVSAPGDA